MKKKNGTKREGKNKYLFLMYISIGLVGIIFLAFLFITSVYKAVLGISVTKSTAVHTKVFHLQPVIYESTLRNTATGQTAVQLLKSVGTTFVFRGTFQWGSGSVDPAYFRKIKNNITQLKQAMPGIRFEGGIGTQYLAQGSIWPDGTPLSSSDYAAMCGHDKAGNCLNFPGANGYTPDLASARYRKYLVEWGERQIDEGIDGMFFDSPFSYAKYKVNTLGYNAMQTYKIYAGYLYNGQDGVVKNLRTYALSKGRKFFDTINAETCNQAVSFFSNYPYMLQPNDYISCSFEQADFNLHSNPSLSVSENFAAIKRALIKLMKKNVPIIAFIDWPGQMTPFEKLTTQQQATILKNIYDATKINGVSFALPVYISGASYDSTWYGTYRSMVKLTH